MIRYIVTITLLATCTNKIFETRTENVAIDAANCPPISSSYPIVTGDIVTTNLRNLVIDNGIVRLEYGAHSTGFRGGNIVENTERHADHILSGRHTDAPTVNAVLGCVSAACHSNGTHWHTAVYPWYGDGVTLSSARLDRDADRVVVENYSQDNVTLSYQWDAVRLDGIRSLGVCNRGVFPQCGPTERDVHGNAVRINGIVQSIKVANIYKTVSINRCDNGYYISLRFDPPLNWPEQGPRALRLGYITTSRSWRCDGTIVAKHPEIGGHVSLGVTDCIADVPASVTGHDGWPFIRYLVTAAPTLFNSLQYAPTQLGSPGAGDIVDSIGTDGRPKQWQAFIGVIEYFGNPIDEPLQQTLDTVNSAKEGVKL